MKNLVIAAFLVFIAQSAFAKIWRVNNNSIYTSGCSNCFNGLQDAINSTSVNPGDTVHLEASGALYDAVNITKKIVIIGAGYFLDENGSLQQNLVSANLLGATFLPGSAGSSIIGVNVAQGSQSYVEIKTSEIKVIRCYIEDGVYISNPTTSSVINITISQCYINDVVSTYYSHQNPIINLTVQNSFIYGHVDLSEKYNNCSGVFAHNVAGLGVSGSSGIKYYNNIFTSNSYTFTKDNNSSTNVYNNIFTNVVPSWLSSSSNMSIPVATVFLAVGSTDGMLQLNPPNISAQCYQGYPGTEQIGMFGGNTPYVFSGIAAIPTIYDLKGSATSFQGDTIKIQIGTRSND